METCTLTIDWLEIKAAQNKNILEAALENGIYIPHLCHHADLVPAGVCRLCMVDVEGRGTVISCKTPVENNLVVNTESPDVRKVRKVALELLLADHTPVCHDCTADGDCELQNVAAYVGVDQERLKRIRHYEEKYPIDSSNPFFDLDPNKCILCGICVRTCDEIEGVNAIDFLYRGYETKVGAFLDQPIKESVCESCGECVSRCPVGALMPKIYRRPSREVKTTCAYCGVGCIFHMGVRGNKIVSIRADRDNIVNKGNLCVKGRYGYNFVNHPDRLTTPLIRKNGELVESSWDEALDLIAEKFAQYRGEEFATLSSAKCTNEDNYVIQKFTRTVQGTNNVDHCARLCHAPTVAGLAQSFGSGAMTNSIAEIPDSACIFAIGTNTTEAHPVISMRIKKAVRNGAKLIVANPKKITLCRHADIFLQHKPGTDVVLLMGMMRLILEDNLHDQSFIDERCENFEEFKKSLDVYDADYVSEITGVPWEKIAEAARWYATLSPASIFFAMGITQHTHGTDNVLATSNLAMLTGNVGKASSGVNPLRGQNNVQGACDLGALPNVYPGYQKVNDPDSQKKFESAWGASLDGNVGLTHTEIFDSINEKKIKALYMVGENPILSEANACHVEESIKQLEFFVSQDIFITESGKFADVILPAASFAEKNGTFTNTERRVQRVRKAIDPPGEALADWDITSRIARKMGAKGFDFSNASEIMDEIASLTPSYGGMSFDRLEDGGLQWPCPSPDHPGTKFLHKEKFATKSGKGKFFPLEYRESAELPDKEYPLMLTTDRSLYHFHTSTMSRRVEGLEIMNSEELLKINSADAERFGLKDSEWVHVFSRRGKIKVRTKVADIHPEGVVSLTFHFHESPTNVLTNNAIDPVAKIPETKVCAVKIEKC
ncbi:formate dehydrogenase subunit alpha [Candidatus Latescibacterota bacterium]